MVLKQESWFENSFITRLSKDDRPSPEAFVLFRGFPGEIPPGQEAKYAHLAERIGLGQALLDATGQDVFLAAYEGLGANRRGKFTFSGSVATGARIAGSLEERYGLLHVVGYSWGGLVAYNAARALGRRRGRLVLIAPVADLSGEGAIHELIAPIVADYPNLFGGFEAAIGPAVAELQTVRDRFNPATLARREGPLGPALVVHGSRDGDVPIGPARALAGFLKAEFVELDDDHIFNAGWDRMLGEMTAFVRGSRRS